MYFRARKTSFPCSDGAQIETKEKKESRPYPGAQKEESSNFLDPRLRCRLCAGSAVLCTTSRLCLSMPTCSTRTLSILKMLVYHCEHVSIVFSLVLSLLLKNCRLSVCLSICRFSGLHTYKMAGEMKISG